MTDRKAWRVYECGCRIIVRPGAWPSHAGGFWWLCREHAGLVEYEVKEAVVKEASGLGATHG